MSEVRLGVVGVGGIGRHHARVCAALEGARLTGVYDIDPNRAREVASAHGAPVFPHLRDLLAAVDAVCVAVPTVDHSRVARAALEAGKHVLVEKPIAQSLSEADEMIRLAESAGRVLQVGHVERFNPAAEVLLGVRGVRFAEVHRLGSFSPRSLDIDVVLDLMVHDLDIVLALDGTAVEQVDAVGVPVLTSRVDIANARLRFASGLIANLTASRVSTDRVRKFRLFAPQTYVSADLAARSVDVHRLGAPGPAGLPEITIKRSEAPEGPAGEPLFRQAQAFVRAVREGSPPAVGGAAGRQVLALATQILDGIGRQAKA